MEYITLGKTGLRVSRLGFGGIPIQRINAEEAQALMDAIHDAGINYIDTARGYTVSEELIGQAIEGYRKDFVLATKSMARDREGMAKDIEISLKNLRTDYIDIYQLHNPSLQQLDQICGEGGALEALMEAKAAGKIGHIGLTAHSLAVFEKALELPWVETFMFPYNIVENQGEYLMCRAQELNIAIIAMKPMAGGAIEDGRLAMRYIRANDAVTVAIPGMYSAEEVRINAEAMSDASPLTADELNAINTVRAELGTNFCRRCNYCAPCTVGINIPGMFLAQGYFNRYGLQEYGRNRYNDVGGNADACVECGECESRCPYHLPIREMLKKVAADFSK